MEQSNGKDIVGNRASEHVESSAAPAATPAIRFEALEPRVLLSGDVNPAAISITGSLDLPGQQNHYQFTVQDAKRVVFDSLTNRSDIRDALINST